MLVPAPPIIRRDGTEFVVTGSISALERWLEPDLVTEHLKGGDYQIWDSNAIPVQLSVTDNRVSLLLTENTSPDPELARMLAPLCGRTTDDPPSLIEIRDKLASLSLPDFTILDLWPPPTSGIAPGGSTDWHRPWEPRHRWSPAEGLKKIPFWKRF